MELSKLQSSPSAFRDAIVIDRDGAPAKLSECLDGWQADDFRALDSGWQVVAGAKKGPIGPKMRAWLERPRGHSKSSDLAIMCTWVLLSRRRLSGYGAAADKDQARMLRDGIDRLVRLNSWLASILDVQAWNVRNRHTGSTLEIISSDAATSYGLLPDFLACDELCHWGKRDLWDSLLSSAAKRSNCMLVVISNAGFQESWQWETREAIRTDPKWYFSRLDGPQASWLTSDRLDEQRRLLPDVAFRRLWLNQWSSGSGDALSDGAICAAVTRDGPMSGDESGYLFYGGLDLGVSRDHSALVVVGEHRGSYRETERPVVLSDRRRMLIEAGLADEPLPEFDVHHEPGTGKIRLAHVQSWQPPRGGQIDLSSVEDAVVDLSRRFRLQGVWYDPYQGALLAQRARAAGVNMVEVPFSGSNLQSMAAGLLESFNSRNVELWDCPELLGQLRQLRIEERSYGYRLTAQRTGAGHGDVGTAFVLAVLAARQRWGFGIDIPDNRKLIVA